MLALVLFLYTGLALQRQCIVFVPSMCQMCMGLDSWRHHSRRSHWPAIVPVRWAAFRCGGPKDTAEPACPFPFPSLSRHLNRVWQDPATRSIQQLIVATFATCSTFAQQTNTKQLKMMMTMSSFMTGTALAGKVRAAGNSTVRLLRFALMHGQVMYLLHVLQRSARNGSRRKLHCGFA